MKLYSRNLPSPLHLRRPFYSIFSTSISTEINPSSPPSPSQSLASPFTYLQYVSNQIKLVYENPKGYSSLTTLDSLLAKTHLLNSATSLVLIDYLSQLNKLGRSKTIISHLKSRGRVSDSFLFSLVFDFLVKDGTIKDVENVWKEICGSVKSYNFSNYVSLVCKFGGVDEIKNLYNRMLMDSASVLEKESYVALCAGLCNANEGFLAKKVVKEMYDKGMAVDNCTYLLMFQCYCRNGDVDEADMVLRKLVRNGFKIDICIYGSFLHGLCKSGKHREAKKLFRKLIKGGPPTPVVLKEGRRAIFQLNCSGVVPEMMAYESYFCALCNAGKLDEAEVLLKKMLSGERLPDICVYGSFIKALFRAGRDSDAMKFFKIQKRKGLVPVDEMGRYVITGLCHNGKPDDALRLFEQENNGSLLVCNCVLDSYWKQSRVVEAEVLFERWRLRSNVATYGIMFNGYCSHNRVSKALVVFQEMLDNKMVVNGELYERLITILCDHGRPDEAFHYSNHMIENGHVLFCNRWRQLFRPLTFFC